MSSPSKQAAGDLAAQLREYAADAEREIMRAWWRGLANGLSLSVVFIATIVIGAFA